MGNMNKTPVKGTEPVKGSNWEVRLLLAAFIVLVLWVMANDDGSDEYCRSVSPGSEWGC